MRGRFCRAGCAKATLPQPEHQQEQRHREAAVPSQPAEPAVLDSALHTAAKAGDAKKVQGSCHLQMQDHPSIFLASCR